MTHESDLIDLYEEYAADARFSHLIRKDSKLVPGVGPYDAKLFVVGKAPGARDSVDRRPFRGANGAVLRSLLNDCAEISSEVCFMTNLVKVRPPGGRKPTVGEQIFGMEYLRREWSLVGRPRVIVAIGAEVFGSFRPEFNITSMAGQVLYQGQDTYLWPMLDPAFGVLHESARPMMERHWTHLGEWMREEHLL